MKAWVLVAALFFWCNAGWAQAGGPLRLRFRTGRVVLATGDTLDGPVALQFGPDLLYLVRPDGSVRTFAPAAVAACAVRDEILDSGQPAVGNLPSGPNPVRLFRTLDQLTERSPPRPEPGFFEQLSGGPVLLVRRQRRTQRQFAYTPVPATAGSGMFAVPMGSNSRGVPPPVPPRYGTVAELHAEYFLALPTGELRPLRNPKRDLLAALMTQAPQVQAYLQAHKVNLSNPRELLDVVDYANSLPVATQP